MTLDAWAVLDTLADGFEVTDHFTGRGTHVGCGECCGRFLPLFPHEVVMLRNASRCLRLRPEQPGVVDMNCPFLDEFDCCMVYGKRPTICRVYDCSKHKAEGVGFAMRATTMGLEPGMRVYDMREVVA